MRHAVILAGGSGVRFWPVSRKRRPKQFLPLGTEQSLLRATFERLLPLIPAERIWVVTAAEHARRVRQEIPELTPARILREPVGRNTAPAIHLAVLAIEAADPGASLVVVPADAWVPRAGAYRRALRSALVAAERADRLVLIGVHPTRPETGYGYIRAGEPLGRGPARAVRRFVEKPTPARARRYVRDGLLWNCGVFAWRTGVYAQAVRRHVPRLDRAFRSLRFSATGPRGLDAAYAHAPSISVDYGVLEAAGNVAVIPATFPWDDLGSWGALERLGSGDGYRHGSVVAQDSPGLIAWSDGGTVAVLGIPNAVVVHTPDATLVMAKDRAQDVRDLVARLEASPGTRHLVEE